jgi:hypothetical protein
MGSPRDTGYMMQDRSRGMMSSVGDTAAKAEQKAEQVGGQVAEAVREAPQMVAERTQGNPVAVGIIAFGAGLLVASLVPTSEMERGVGQQLKESGPDLIEPIREPLAESGQRLKDDLSDSVGEAAHEVKQTAKDSAQTAVQETKGAAQQQMTDRT